MTPFAELSGIALARLHLVIPALGLWHADALLSEAVDVSGPQTLVLSGSTWTCAAVRAVDFAGARGIRLVGGAGGWRKPIPAQQYASAAGVPTVTVLGDAASLVGEPAPVLDPTVPATVGAGFIRQAGPASLVLQQLEDIAVLPAWWLSPSGVVQTGARDTSAITSAFDVLSVRGATGWYRVTTDAPGDWQPGRSFSSSTASASISRVEHRIERGELWTEVLSP